VSGGLLIALTVGTAFAAGLVWPVSLRVLLVALLLLVLVRSAPTSTPKRAAVLLLAALVALIAMLVLEFATPAQFAPERELWVRYCVLFPLALLTGATLSSGDKTTFVRAFVWFGLFNAAIACAEFVTQTRFFATVLLPSASDFGFRAGVGAEHPLVLACLLAAAAPFVAVVLRKRSTRAAALILLLAATASTGSAGVTLILTAFVLVLLVGADRVIARRKLLPIASSALLAGLLVTGMFIDYNAPLIAAVGDGASDLYRLVLYAFSGRTLVDMPLGWGLQGLPEGLYVIPSAYGPLDLARTIDSEFVLLVVELGWLGVLASFLLICLPWMRRADAATRWSAWIATTSGFFLALHAWAGLPAIICLVLGAAMSGGLTANRAPDVATGSRRASLSRRSTAGRTTRSATA